MIPLREVRCCGCGRLLFKADGDLGTTIEIKCPRCRQFNHLRPDRAPEPERDERRERAADVRPHPG